MAQRVSLVQMPAHLLERVARAICGDAARRREVPAVLAAEGAPHLQRVAVSERVIHSVPSEDPGERWAFARYCMPYLLSSSLADETASRLRTLRGLQGEQALEDFFVEEARQLGATPGALDRTTFQPPAIDAVAEWIRGQLDRAAKLHELASAALKLGGKIEEEDSPIGDYVVSTWIWLGRIFARTHASFWQGRNRWLGGAAFPEAFEVRTRVTSVGERPSLWQRFWRWIAGEPSDPGLEAIAAATREQTRQQLASCEVSGLRAVLQSTATLVPVLAMAPWAEALPPAGSGNLVSGAVRVDSMDALIAAMRQAMTDSTIPYDGGNEWGELVVAAAITAKEAGAHLVEGDDVTYGRWPILDS